MTESKFKAITKHSGKLKTLFEVIFFNVGTANWQINKSGMLLEEVTKQNLLIKIFLPAESFDEYHFEGQTTLNVGLGSNIIKEFFKSVKNKDKISMSMVGPYDFLFEKNGDTNSQSLKVSTENFIVINQVFPEYTSQPIDLPGAEYSQLCRSFTTPLLTVTKQNGEVVFTFATGRSEKKLRCGKRDFKDSNLIHRDFYCEQFNRLSKINSFATSPIKIYYEPDKPLCFVANSSIGVMTIIIEQKQED